MNNVAGTAQLTLLCRPGEPVSGTLRISAPLAGRFRVAEFEGPGGIGERARPLGFRLAGGTVRSFYSSGSFQQGGTFEWAFTPLKAEVRRWLKAPGKGIEASVVNPAASTSSLMVGFRLPADNAALREVVTPCLR